MTRRAWRSDSRDLLGFISGHRNARHELESSETERCIYGLCFRGGRVSRWNVASPGWGTSTAPRECRGWTEAEVRQAAAVPPLSSSDLTLSHHTQRFNGRPLQQLKERSIRNVLRAPKSWRQPANCTAGTKNWKNTKNFRGHFQTSGAAFPEKNEEYSLQVSGEVILKIWNEEKTLGQSSTARGTRYHAIWYDAVD